ncbi:MAG: AbgT family transporter [Myxococcota bacterium]
MSSPEPADRPQPPPRRGLLDWIEWAGNKLPEPVLLFVILAAVVLVVSAVGHALDWSVQPVKPTVELIERLDATGAPVLDDAGAPRRVPKLGEDGLPIVTLVDNGAPVTPRSLLTADGFYWAMSSMLRNFTGLPALGLIFVAMLGIGVAEKFGFFSALMRFLAILTPARLLTPAIVLLGANASVASDAGYIILPPLAAALYGAVGRHPIAGLAAAFAGVSGGFGAGFFPTGGDGALAGFAQDAARVIDPEYTVNILHNAFFKAGSVGIVTIAGWFVTDRVIEPRLLRAGLPVEGGDDVVRGMALTARERTGLGLAIAAGIAVIALFAAFVLVPGAPLYGPGQPALANDLVIVHQAVTVAPGGTETAAAARDILAREPLLVTETAAKGRLAESPGTRWSHVIVPMIFFAFLVPGLVYGGWTGALRRQQDFVDALYHGIRSIVPVLAIAFFMAQFVNWFAYTRLDRMLAYAGGSLLVEASLPIPMLLTLFVLLVVMGDFAISGMLSKFGVLAPIFIPMFMMVGISPELTVAAYRIGDSVVNIVTPLNSYQLIILAVLQKYRKDAGIGTLMSLMVPYSVVFGLTWTGLLLAWYAFGVPVGVGGPLHYVPPH